MRARIILVAMAIVAALPVASTTRGTPRMLQTQSAPPALSEDESGVYAAIFGDLFQASSDTPIMLLDHTSVGVPPGMWTVSSVQGPDTAKFLAQVSVETRQDYQLKNKSSVRLAGECHVAPRCEFDNVVALTAIVGGEKEKMDKGWKEFTKRFPNAPGIFVVSRVGFNRDHSEALAYAAKSCGKQCGDGYYVWLAKRGSKWSVAQQTTIWIAGSESR